MVEREDVEISQRCVEAKGGVGRCDICEQGLN